MKRFLLFGFMLLCLAVTTNAQQPLSPADFEKAIAQPKVQLLDVRTANEYKQSHIANSLQADWLKQEQFTDRIQYLDKSKPVYVYCAAGGRSAQAVKYLREKGFTNVYDLQGGLASWKMEKRAVDINDAKAQMRVDRYRQLASAAKVVLVDFGAEWCPPCVKMKPVLDSLQKAKPGAFNFVKVDGGNDTDVMSEAHVEALPTFIIYKNGKEVWRKQGLVTLSEFKKQL